MSYAELQADELTTETVDLFWRSISELGLRGVAINLVTETATLEATSQTWRATGHGPIGIRLNLFELMRSWEELVSSSISDAEYDATINTEARKVIHAIESRRSPNIDVTYTVDDSAFILA